MNYKRNIIELEEQAIKWWPQELMERFSDTSVIPKLISTQKQFISILSLASTPESVFSLIAASNLPANLFLKHLCILADYGGEPLQRLGGSFDKIFPERYMTYQWGGDKEGTYHFQCLPVRGLGNKKLMIDGAGLSKNHPLSTLYKDLIMLLLYGSTSQSAEQAGLDKCEIGLLLGDAKALEEYVDQRYIFVSRITGGATANTLGQLAQQNAAELLKAFLPDDLIVVSNGTVILDRHPKQSGMPFDLVVSHPNIEMKIGIEVSFQVTTNSTIERKSGQSVDRRVLMHDEGHKIAYIIDGAGNFQRSSAVSTICSNSDCTVAYSSDEIKLLAGWIKKEYDNIY